MQQASMGGLTVRITGGTDREGGGDGPVVVMLHGYGAPGDDLVALWRVLDVPREVRFVFPEAPMSLPELGAHGARAWWKIDFESRQPGSDRSDEVPGGLVQAREAIVALLDAVEQELNVEPERLLRVVADRKLAALALLSPTLIARSRWQPAMAARSDLPIFISHGERDPLLPFGASEKLRDMWREAGAQVKWVQFNGAHEIPQTVLESLGAFIRDNT